MRLQVHFLKCAFYWWKVYKALRAGVHEVALKLLLCRDEEQLLAFEKVCMAHPSELKLLLLRLTAINCVSVHVHSSQPYARPRTIVGPSTAEVPPI